MKKLEELGISPVPWTVPPIDNDFVHSANGDKVCQVQWIAEDADLIAAAPKLYDALHDVVAYCESTHLVPSEIFGKVLEKAKAALAKASGESEVET